jgi:hypothetical protein
MTGLWSSLIPLIVGSALVPVQIVVTVLLLRSSAGRFTAVAWVAGMTTVRLAQGVVFGLVLGSATDAGSSADGPGTAASLLLLVVAIVFYVSAVKQLLREPDEDAPAPRWMAALEGIAPAKAYLMGAGLLVVSVKFWVFTLGAIAAIEEAAMGQTASVVTYLVFVVLAQSVTLVIIGIAYVMPHRAATLLDGISSFLSRNNRVIVIAIGAVFGTWFLLKALDGLGVL